MTETGMHEIIEGARATSPDAHKRAIKAMERLMDPSRKMIQQFRPLWALVRAYAIGCQNVEVTGDGKVRKKPAKFKKYFYSNQMQPRLRSMTAGLTANKPVFQAITKDERDYDALQSATVGDQVLAGLRETLRLDAKVRGAVYRAALYCQSYLHAGFDGTLGRTVAACGCASCNHVWAAGNGMTVAAALEAQGIEVDDSGVRPEAAEQMRTMLEAELCPLCGQPGVSADVKEGDTFISILGPDQLYWAEAAETLEQSPWIVIEHQMSKQEAESRFGAGEWREDNIEDSLTVAYEGAAADVPARKAVRVFEALVLPCDACEHVFRFMWHGSRVLDARDLDWLDGRYPVAMIFCDDVDGRFIKKGVGEDLVPLQRLWNEVMRDLKKLAELSRDPRYMAEEGAITPEDEARYEEGGKYLKYQTGHQKPEYEKPPVVSPVFSFLLQSIGDQMDFIAQQYAPGRGQPGGNVTSGFQARLLVERQATSLGGFTYGIEEAVARVGKVLMLAAQRFFPEEKLLTYAGENGRPRVVRFRSADLRGVQDVTVVTGSAFPESKEARRDFLMQAAEAAPEADRRALFDAMQAGIKFPPDPQQKVKDKAEDENDRMLRREPVAVSVYDVHDVELPVHKLFMQSEKFRSAPPQIQMLVAAHVEAHEEATVQDAIRNAVKQARVQAAVQAATAPPAAAGVDAGDPRMAALTAELTGSAGASQAMAGNLTPGGVQ